MSDLETGSDEARRMLRAAVFLVNKGLKDKVFAVSMATRQNIVSHLHLKTDGIIIQRQRSEK